MLTPEETSAVLKFNKILWDEVAEAVKGDRNFKQKEEEEMLVLSKDGTTMWKADWRWPQLREAEKVFRP